MDYSEAHKHLVQSLRKAPSSAIGFRHTVHKLSTVVQLLLGNIPERQLFLQPANKEALAPYFELTKGTLVAFLYARVNSLDFIPLQKFFKKILKQVHLKLELIFRQNTSNFKYR